MIKKLVCLIMIGVFAILGVACTEKDPTSDRIKKEIADRITSDTKQDKVFFDNLYKDDKFSFFSEAKWTSTSTRDSHFDKHVADISKGEKWNEIFGYSESKFKKMLETKAGRNTLFEEYDAWMRNTMKKGEVFSYTYEGTERIGFYDEKNNIFVTTNKAGTKVYTCFRPDNERKYIEGQDNYKKLKR